MRNKENIVHNWEKFWSNFILNLALTVLNFKSKGEYIMGKERYFVISKTALLEKFDDLKEKIEELRDFYAKEDDCGVHSESIHPENESTD